MELVINFDNISLSLKWEDVVNLSNTNKKLKSLCNENYWNNKAKQIYNYDLRYAEGTRIIQKYSWLESCMNIPFNCIVGVDSYHNYFWNKKIEWDFGIINAVDQDGYASFVRDQLVSFKEKRFYNHANKLAICRAGYARFKNIIIQYGPKGIINKLPPMPIQLQKDIENYYISTMLPDLDRGFILFCNKLIKENRIMDIMIYLDRYDSDFCKNDMLAIKILWNSDNLSIPMLQFASTLFSFCIEKGIRQGKSKQISTLNLLYKIICKGNATHIMVEYLINSLEVPLLAIKELTEQINKNPLHAKEETINYLNNIHFMDV